MAKRRHSNRRHRRGSSGFLYKLLSVLVICGAIVTALTLFFRVDEVHISGQERYTEQQILNASGVQEGDNLFLLNRAEVARRLTEELPYIEKIRINPKAPDRLYIEVTESGTPLAVVQDGFAWLVSPSGDPNGKIVEQLDAAAAEKYGLIEGCKLLAPAVGDRISLATEFSAQQTGLLSLLKALEEQNMMEQVDAVDLSDLSTLTLRYAGRFRILLPYDADFSLKIKGLKAILASEKIQDNMTGALDMRREDGKANFIPDRR